MPKRKIPAADRCGWIPDIPDHRDRRWSTSAFRAAPSKVDLRGALPAVYDQGDIGSCTAQALIAVYQWNCLQQSLPADVPSALFVYYNERVAEHTVGEDAGAMLRTGIKVLAKQGVCVEGLWPYRAANLYKKPIKPAYNAAKYGLIDEYRRVTPSVRELLAVLATRELVVFGAALYESFESAAVQRRGIVSMPKSKEAMLGGHAMTLVGYDRPAKRFLVRNSWGAGWGDQGYCTMPFDYVANTDLCDDFWTITFV